MQRVGDKVWCSIRKTSGSVYITICTKSVVIAYIYFGIPGVYVSEEPMITFGVQYSLSVGISRRSWKVVLRSVTVNLRLNGTPFKEMALFR